MKEKVSRPYTYVSGSSTMGRSVIYITCPFCHARIRAYVWSVAGSGKLCTCGAKFSWAPQVAGKTIEQPAQEEGSVA